MSQGQPKVNDFEFIAFRKICFFVEQLKNALDGKYHEINLFNHLLSKIEVSDNLAIQKIVKIFKDFCLKNNDAIIRKKYKNFVTDKIVFSSKVFINITQIMEISDLQTRDIIWQHLLTIYSCIDPTSEARKVLEEIIQSKKHTEVESGKSEENDGDGGNEKEEKEEGQTPEDDFLEEIFSKVQNKIDPSIVQGGNPIQAINSIMQSGILPDLIGTIDKNVKNGTLNLNKLVGTAQNLVSQLPEDQLNAGGVNFGGMMNMVTSMLGNSDAGNSDISINPMSMLGPDGLGDMLGGDIMGMMSNMGLGGDQSGMNLIGTMGGGSLPGLNPDQVMKEIQESVDREMEMEREKEKEKEKKGVREQE